MRILLLYEVNKMILFDILILFTKKRLVVKKNYLWILDEISSTKRIFSDLIYKQIK